MLEPAKAKVVPKQGREDRSVAVVLGRAQAPFQAAHIRVTS